MKVIDTSRRGFLKGVLAAGAAPLVIPSGVLYGATAPSNRVNLASIGVGNQGSGNFGTLLQPDWIRVVAVADCFKDRREARAKQANERYGGKVCTPYRDFREILVRPDVDGVVCSTPDHWHHGVAVLSMQAGKDVYIEKPLTLSINDNKHVRDTVYRYGRVFQYGTQQRSGSHVRMGCELVRAGVLGKLIRIEVVAPCGPKGGGSLEPLPVPDGLDYDMWLGPTRDRPYTKDRCTNSGAWYASDCSIGFLGGWGAHPLDVMAWALGDLPELVPVELEATGERGKGLFDTVTNWRAKGRFANGVDFAFTTGDNCTTFVGERGKIMISRGYLKAEPMGLLREPLPPRREPLRANTTGFHHTADFAQCIKTRETPCSNIDGAYHSDNISHLTNIACLTGRKITWDLEKQTIVNDEEAVRMMGRKIARYPYVV
jgi:glucose-fructose oxidoreductase